jgi:type II secretory pathway pseudopilin PulG
MVTNLSISSPMKNPSPSSNRKPGLLRAGAFTLTETVIAIGVLAVLLTGFIAVFTPAAQGIRRAINSEQADRLATTLEMEMVTLRVGQHTPEPATGFDKAFKWMQEGDSADTAIFVYQYRGNPSSIRGDGTPTPTPTINGEPGKDYIVQSIARRIDDAELVKDIKAIEGSVFFVKLTQLVDDGGELVLGTPGEIKSADGTVAATAPAYKEAVIAFTAEFHSIPTKTIAYLESPAFAARFGSDTKKPIFTRNLAVRR